MTESRASPPAAVSPVHRQTLPGLAHVLIASQLLTENRAQEIAGIACANKISFVAQLVGSGELSAPTLAQQLSIVFGLPQVDLGQLNAQSLPQDLLDLKLCLTHKVLPLQKRDNRLLVATADPSDKEATEKIKFSAQIGVDWVIAEYDKLAHLLESISNNADASFEGASSNSDFDFEDVQDLQPPEEPTAGDAEIADAPVVKFLHKMLVDAVNAHASDLHFEPYEQHYRVRFRIDGELREVAAPPLAIKEKLAARIKVISRLDISEKRTPQDGRMKLQLGSNRVIDFRVSTLPTLFGEKIVIRLLNPSSAQMGMDDLGYEAAEKQRLLDAIARPHGMILVTGPTGSGKTVSLYSCLHLLNQPGVNISTVEDPSEIPMPGINQVNVNDKAGLSFASALRAFLRQDPDVIMVGEIRDVETADIAIKAAQTGHLVLSTVHTNDAPQTLVRLRNMGIAPFNIASSVTLIVAQRLVRRLCPQCKQPHPASPSTLMAAGFTESQINASWQAFQAVGCSACHQGYQGRIGIYQVMPISDAIQAIILRDGNVLDIAKQAADEGVKTLRESGLEKVRQGITSLEEILAATPL